MFRRRRDYHPQLHGREIRQTLVEFALVFPLFMLLMLFIIEFAFVFSALLGVNSASRNAALTAAEAGNDKLADCIILQQVETSIGAPGDRAKVQTVTIYRTDQSGSVRLATPARRRRHWSGHAWTRADLADDLFMARLTFTKPTCGGGSFAQVDTLQVRVSSKAGPRPVYDPTGVLLAPQNFWGAMQSQGAPNIQGDAFMIKYQDRSPLTLNSVDAAQDPDSYFDPVNYYNYGIEMRPTRRAARSGSSIRDSARSPPAREPESRGRSVARTGTRARSR